MELLATWRTLYKLRYCPITLIQTAFTAGTVYLLIAMQARSGSRIARKELRHSLDQETLVQQYLQEIGVSWNCATHISATLRRLMDEQVRPHLDVMDRNKIPIIPGSHTSADIDEEEENNSGRGHARSSSSEWSSPSTLTHTRSSSSGWSSTSTLDSWSFQPSPGSSPHVNHLPSSFAHHDFRKHTQPFSNFSDDPFFGNDNRSSDDVEQGFGGLISFLPINFQRNPSAEYLGMLGGQTLSETPFVGFLGGVEDNSKPNFSNFFQAPFANGFSNHESSSKSLGEHVPPSSHGGNESVDLDNMPWIRSFTS